MTGDHQGKLDPVLHRQDQHVPLSFICFPLLPLFGDCGSWFLSGGLSHSSDIFSAYFGLLPVFGLTLLCHF